MTTQTAQRNWLHDYQATGCFYAGGDPEHPSPFSCANCGQGIANVVQARHRTTGEVITVGPDCADRIGLTDAALKAHYADKFAVERREAQRRRWQHEAEVAAANAHAEATGLPEADLVAAVYRAAQVEHERRGGHGDVTKNGGWDGTDTMADYPYQAVNAGKDVLDGHANPYAVLEAIKALGEFTPAPFRRVDGYDGTAHGRCLYTLDGEPQPAKRVDTQYGVSWMLLDTWGGRCVGWFNDSKARNEATARKNNAKKGYYVGEARWVKAGNRSKWWPNMDEAPVALTDNGQLAEEDWKRTRPTRDEVLAVGGDQ